MGELKQIPSVEKLLQTKPFSTLVEYFGHVLVLKATRETLSEIRKQFKDSQSIPPETIIAEQTKVKLEAWFEPTLKSVINATGVILHTNLGRAPLSTSARKAMEEIGAGYSSLEFDLDKGQRGDRAVHTERLLQLLTGAESALVVNNNASAVLLVLSALAKRKRVIISRSQLVEIGGGFRVPEVLKESGAILAEVGTTNRVHPADFSKALETPAAAILRVHPSNFKIIGFTEEPELETLVKIAHEHSALLIDDLGSGAFMDTTKYGLAHEPMVQESIKSGADIVCFSGDKLVGGPQAGIILGRKSLLDKIKKHSLARALRADKLCLAGLSQTLEHYLKDEAIREIPTWKMIAMKSSTIRARAESLAKGLGFGEVVGSQSAVGGGSMPGETLQSYVLSLPVKKPEVFLAKLRKSNPPIVARIENDRVVLDPRTVLDDQDETLLKALHTLLSEEPNEKRP